MKAAVVTQRAEVKDYLDVYALLTKTKISLATMLAAAAIIYGAEFNPLVSLKAISYHDDPGSNRTSRQRATRPYRGCTAYRSVAITDTRCHESTRGKTIKPLPHNPDLLSVAPRVIWFEPPEQALADSIRFLAYVMTYATPDEIAVVRRYVSLDDLQEALDHAPPGIIDERSWAYWNAMIGRYPAPDMPRRVFPESPFSA
jgi:hypothetical protein